MEEWTNPEIQELEIRNTEIDSFTGTKPDGTYVSNDKKITGFLYSQEP